MMPTLLASPVEKQNPHQPRHAMEAAAGGRKQTEGAHQRFEDVGPAAPPTPRSCTPDTSVT